MRGGLAVGVPLTLLQLGLHQHTGAPVDALTVANNFLLANAVYDADRIEAGPWAAERLPTRASALLSCAYYVMDARTAVLAPVVLLLHAGYADLKPYIAPAKPFVVAALWTVCIYYVPLWRAVSETHADVLAPASLLLSVASLSHAADVADIDEDRALGLHTPAVRMGMGEAAGYTVALAFASAFLHSQSPSNFLPYDAVALAVLAGLLFERVEVAVVISLAIVAAHASAHDVELVGALLRSTEHTHKFGIEASVGAIEFAPRLPEPLQTWLVEATMAAVRGGDRFGSLLLDLYQHVVRNRF